jgi:hypothetical protein
MSRPAVSVPTIFASAGQTPSRSGFRVNEQNWDGRLDQQWSITSVDGTNGVAIQSANRLTGYVLNFEPGCVSEEACFVEQSRLSNDLHQQWEVISTT